LCWDTVKCGVLQGCVLGPSLLNMYINDFPKIIKKLNPTILFADRTSIVVTSAMFTVLNQKFNSNLHDISKWFQTSQLVLNATETFTVNLTSSKAPI
jgi:hypothetical protein